MHGHRLGRRRRHVRAWATVLGLTVQGVLHGCVRVFLDSFFSLPRRDEMSAVLLPMTVASSSVEHFRIHLQDVSRTRKSRHSDRKAWFSTCTGHFPAVDTLRERMWHHRCGALFVSVPGHPPTADALRELPWHHRCGALFANVPGRPLPSVTKAQGTALQSPNDFLR